MDIREQIACQSCVEYYHCDHKIKDIMRCFYQLATSDKILSIPNIKEVLSLLELKRQGKLYKDISDDPLDKDELCYIKTVFHLEKVETL
jgi:hypothetical protein